MSILMELNRPEEFTALRFAADVPPRSREYRDGFLVGVAQALGETCGDGAAPFDPGTVEWDAWYAGFLEGCEHLKPYIRAQAPRNITSA